MQVVHHLDDLFHQIRNSLHDHPHPLLVKIIDESSAELHVFKIDTRDSTQSSHEQQLEPDNGKRERIRHQHHQQSEQNTDGVLLFTTLAQSLPHLPEQYRHVGNDECRQLQHEVNNKQQRILELEACLCHLQEELLRVRQLTNGHPDTDNGNSSDGLSDSASATTDGSISDSEMAISMLHLRNASVDNGIYSVVDGCIGDSTDDDDDDGTGTETTSNETVEVVNRAISRRSERRTNAIHRFQPKSTTDSAKHQTEGSRSSDNSRHALPKEEQDEAQRQGRHSQFQERVGG
jgi:hypothetical protein